MKKILIVFVFSLGLGNTLQAGINIGSAGAVLRHVKKVDEKMLVKKKVANPCDVTPCTSLGGVVSVNTTWTLAKSPYKLTSKVQVANGATLTIDPGVAVYGNWQDIQVFGTLSAIGTNAQKIILDTLSLDGTSLSSTIGVQFARINQGYVNYSGGGAFSLKDSVLENSGTISFTNPGADCYVERNIFKTAGIMVDNITGSPIYIRNNVFVYQLPGHSIMPRIEIAGTNPIIIEKNSFLSTDQLALTLDYWVSSQATAINNYWNTADTAIIDGMIWDHNDDLSINNTVTYIPFLSAPDPATPALQ